MEKVNIINEQFEEFIHESIEQDLENKYFEEIINNTDLQSKEEKRNYWAKRNRSVMKIFDLFAKENVQGLRITRSRVPVLYCNLTKEEYGKLGRRIKPTLKTGNLTFALINDGDGYRVQIY